MKIDQASEILKDIRHTGHYQPTRDDVAALELGIEALTLLSQLRQVIIVPLISRLPSEDP